MAGFIFLYVGNNSIVQNKKQEMCLASSSKRNPNKTVHCAFEIYMYIYTVFMYMYISRALCTSSGKKQVDRIPPLYA